MVYLISYDLIGGDRDYAEIRAVIESLGRHTWAMGSVWIVEHPGPAGAILDALRKHCRQEDKLLVVECANDVAQYNLNPKLLDHFWLFASLRDR